MVVPRLFARRFQDVTFLTLHRLFKYSTKRRFPSPLTAFKARVGSMIHRLSSVRVVLCSSSNISFIGGFIRCVRRCASVFGVGSNNEFIRSVRYLTHVALKRFHDRLCTLTLASKRHNKKLSRLSVTRSRFLSGLGLVRCLKRVLRRLRHAISNRVRRVNGKLTFGTRFRHLTIVTFTITRLTERVRVQRRVRLGTFMTITLTDLTTSTASIRKRTSHLVSACLHFKRTSGRVTSVKGRANVDNEVKAQHSSREELIRVRRLICVFRPFGAIVIREVLR